MNRKNALLIYAAAVSVVFLTGIPSPHLEASPIEKGSINPDLLSAVGALHGLNKEQAMSRLAHEAEAARIYQTVKELDLPSYAGSWFDDDSWRLNVALSDPSDSTRVKRLGATPVIVENSFDELERVWSQSRDALRGISTSPIPLKESYVDYRLNRVVIGVAQGSISTVQAALRAAGVDQSLIEIREMDEETRFSTGDVRGADGVRNFTWQDDEDTDCTDGCPCSIGASVVGGFVFAGHCGYAEDTIDTAPPQETLGEVIASDGPFYQTNNDGAWVETVAGWSPSAKINGYTDGTLYVDAEFAGMLAYPAGSTVCRYGQTSFGPHCGVIEARDVTWSKTGSFLELDGMIKTSSICQDDGDSGGPLVTGSVQVQGTLSTGTANSCPDSSDDVGYYQPIDTTLTTLAANDLILRTTHGPQAPAINIFSCPDSGNSGSGQYWCEIKSYYSQGTVSYYWTTSTGQTSTASFVSDSCSTGEIITVDVEISNTYGSTFDSAQFECPDGTIK